MAGSAAAQSCSASGNASGSYARGFGGWDTSWVSVYAFEPGHYRVTCFGSYYLSDPPNSVFVNVTAESGQYGVANARVLSATDSEIIFEVWTWRSAVLTPVSNLFFVTVYVS